MAEPVYGNHRKIWSDVFGEIPKDQNGRSYHIHHIDGNPLNNCLDNLLCLSPQEHYEIHKSQGDYGAAFMLLNNHLKISATERSLICSKANEIRWINYSDLEKKNIINKNRKTNIKTWSSVELRKKSGNNISISHGKRTKEQKQQESIKKSDSAKLAWKTESHKAHREHMLNKIVCPHCGKEGQKAAMSRYHFDRCKSYGTTIIN